MLHMVNNIIYMHVCTYVYMLAINKADTLFVTKICLEGSK